MAKTLLRHLSPGVKYACSYHSKKLDESYSKVAKSMCFINSWGWVQIPALLLTYGSSLLTYVQSQLCSKIINEKVAHAEQ